MVLGFSPSELGVGYVGLTTGGATPLSMDLLHDLIVDTVGDWGYLAVFVLMTLESACIPIPSEVTMPVGGLLAAEGTLNIWLVGLVGAFANLVGSWIAYYAGAVGGRPVILRWGRYVRLRPHDLDRAHDWFERYGVQAVFWSRLLPVVRTFISLPAGMARMKLVRFSVYSFLGSLPWSLGLAYGGYVLGRNWEKLASNVELAAFVVAGLLVAGVVFLWVRARRRRAAPDSTAP
jgi:membrane protein DedA with SNARE-associated domain